MYALKVTAPQSKQYSQKAKRLSNIKKYKAIHAKANNDRYNEKKGKKKVQGVPQSQTAALPRNQEEEETEKKKKKKKKKQAQIELIYEKH